MNFSESIDSATKEYLKGLEKRLTFYSKTHSYQMDDFSQNTVQPIMVKHVFYPTDDFNFVSYAY